MLSVLNFVADRMPHLPCSLHLRKPRKVVKRLYKILVSYHQSRVVIIREYITGLFALRAPGRSKGKESLLEFLIEPKENGRTKVFAIIDLDGSCQFFLMLGLQAQQLCVKPS